MIDEISQKRFIENNQDPTGRNPYRARQHHVDTPFPIRYISSHENIVFRR
jgi:hypothetical protein